MRAKLEAFFFAPKRLIPLWCFCPLFHLDLHINYEYNEEDKNIGIVFMMITYSFLSLQADSRTDKLASRVGLYRGQTGGNNELFNRKNQKRIASVICILVIIAMVLPMVLEYLVK